MTAGERRTRLGHRAWRRAAGALDALSAAAGPAFLFLAVVALGGFSDPPVTEIAERVGWGAAGFAGQSLRDVFAEGVSWVLLCVLALVTAPWLAAVLVFVASQIHLAGGTSRSSRR